MSDLLVDLHWLNAWKATLRLGEAGIERPAGAAWLLRMGCTIAT
jgi:hypothetical protein